MSTKKIARGRLLPLVGQFFREHPGQVVYLDDLVENIGGNRQTIQAYVTRLRTILPPQEFETITGGHAWRYTPNRKVADIDATDVSAKPSVKSRQVFEEVGRAKDGSLILESESGSLYRASEL